MSDQWTLVAAGLFGLFLFVGGVLAYRGTYRAWLVLKGAFLPGWIGLSGLYIGLALMMVPFIGPVLDSAPPILVLVFAAVFFLSMVVGLLAVFWLPGFLLPGWVKDSRERMRRGEDRYSQAMRPGGALHGRLSDDPRTPVPPAAGGGGRPEGENRA